MLAVTPIDARIEVRAYGDDPGVDRHHLGVAESAR
jgi:hypothetical protein